MKVLYVTFSNPEKSINSVYINGLRENGVDVLVYSSKGKGVAKFYNVALWYRQNKKESSAVIVGYDNPGLVIWLRIFGAKPIVYNALCSVYERLVISRDLVSKYSVKALYYWLLDFLACRLAHLVMLETEQQIKFFKKMFFLSGNNLMRAWIGVNENEYFFEDAPKHKDFTVLFRGRLLPESGAELVVKAAKILEKKNIQFVMFSFGRGLHQLQRLISDLQPKNLRLVIDYMPIDRIRNEMQKCHLSLGQLSDHPRTSRTIPHKAFESMAMKIPYLTASNTGIMEILTDRDTCLTCQPANAEDLASKIMWAMNNQQAMSEIADRAFQLFESKYKSDKLAKILLDTMRDQVLSTELS